jgi:hypothetical protein
MHVQRFPFALKQKEDKGDKENKEDKITPFGLKLIFLASFKK